MSTDWTPSSWKDRPALQQPAYPDARALEEALARLARLPPLVTSWEVEALKAELALAARGERFLLQGGDCSESFEECQPGIIANQLKVLLQMSLVLVHGTRRRVIRVGRFAGQYAKPRSADTETRGGLTLPSYRGDIINRAGFSEAERTPDPQLLLEGYKLSALTLNFIRSLAAGGFADLHHPENWDLGFVRHSSLAEEYGAMVRSIGESLRFMEAVTGTPIEELSRVDFYSSHEALHLLYETALTRRVPRRPGWYNLSTHFPWIGDRTHAASGAHVEYCRGLRNPLGVKVGPSTSPEELAEVLDLLHPADEPGRLTLIHRFGAERISRCLPPLVEAVRRSGKTVLWCSDPMHGNGETTRSGVKTRNFSSIISELEQAFEIHRECGSVLGGVHFELTGEDVTECIGGARGLTEADLSRAYRSQVDPRLNCEQALEMAMRIARHLAKANGKAP
jgi:3-deoxy-7-phosphoheptulonate synthase